VREAQHVYFERYRFKHPTADDFMNTVSEVAGQNLDWYWNQAARGTQVLDYRILSAGSERADWADKTHRRKRRRAKRNIFPAWWCTAGETSSSRSPWK